jgi:heme exporter protein D
VSGVLDFAAGKYAVFVWPAYGLTAIVFAALIVETLLRARRWRREVEQCEARAAAKDGRP